LGYDECKVRCRLHNVKAGAQSVCRCRMVARHNSSLQNLALYVLVGDTSCLHCNNHPAQVAIGERQGTKTYTTMTTTTKQIATKFVKWDVPALDTLKGSKVYQLRLHLNEGKRLTREEKNWLTENLMHNAYFRKSIPLMGYRFSFEDVVRRFFVRQGQTEYTVYAIDTNPFHEVKG